MKVLELACQKGYANRNAGNVKEGTARSGKVGSPSIFDSVPGGNNKPERIIGGYEYAGRPGQVSM